MAEVQTLPDYPRGLDFQQVWASLQETKQILREDSQRLKEELNEKIGALTNLFGDVTEAMVAPKICEKFGN